MLYLGLAIASSALVSIIMRISEKYVQGNVGMLVFNYVMCLGMAGFYTGFENVWPQDAGSFTALGMGLFNGILYLLGFVLLQINVKKNGVVLSATFMKLGLLVPMIVSVVLFRELPSLVQSVGFLLAIAAIILINFEQEETSMEFKAGLFLLLLAGGGGDAMSKIYEELGNPAYSEQFLLYTFGAALVLCAALVLYRREHPGCADLLFGMLIGIPNFFSARFLLKSLQSLSAVIVYPTYSVATLVVITLAGVCFFKERLGKRQWIAVGVIFLSLILLNL